MVLRTSGQKRLPCRSSGRFVGRVRNTKHEIQRQSLLTEDCTQWVGTRGRLPTCFLSSMESCKNFLREYVEKHVSLLRSTAPASILCLCVVFLCMGV